MTERDQWARTVRRMRHQEERASRDPELRRRLEDELEALVDAGCTWPSVLERLDAWYRRDGDLASALEVMELAAATNDDPRYQKAAETLKKRIENPTKFHEERKKFLEETKKAPLLATRRPDPFDL